jgi:hypothetical protein
MEAQMLSFRVSALPAETFQPLYGLCEAELAARGVVRVAVPERAMYPCRVSLRDATHGETVLLLNYEHQPVPTPFRASHAIFVCEGAVRVAPAANQVPDMLRARLLSVRAFDAACMMVDADAVEGVGLEPVIERLLAREDVAFLHVHFAKRGCYAARVDRV